jgi:hypothetical protein
MSGASNNPQPRGRFVSPLARWIGRTPASDVELRALRRRAWHETGVVVLRPEEIDDAFARQALINAAQALFGRRGRPHDVNTCDRTPPNPSNPKEKP